MKRIIAIILTIILALTNINYIASASESFDEVYYKEAIMLLEALGIKDGSSNSTLTGESITRMDFLKTVVRAVTGSENIASTSADFRFTDVANDTGIVSYAVSAGLIADGPKFYPDEDADIDFAMSLITASVGYELKDIKYVQSAVKTGLTKKLRYQSNTQFSMGDAYVLVYNLLCAGKVEKYGDSYAVRNDTILTDLYEVELVKGRMVAGFGSSIYGENLSDNVVKISNSNGEITLRYDGDKTELLGRNVKAYYVDEVAILLMAANESDIILNISGKEYVEYDGKSRRVYYNVYESSNRWETSVKLKNKTLPQNMDIIHNGKFTDEHSKVYSILKDGNGSNVDNITLIDADHNGKPDLMRIDTYQTVFVTQPSKTNMYVKDNLTKKIIDFDGNKDGTEVSVFNIDGDEVKFDNITENSVISIFETNGDPKKIKIIVSTAVISGTVSEFTEYGVIVEGEEFFFSDNFKSFKNDIAKAGVNYSFYLDHNSKISGYKLGAGSTENLGGIIKIRRSEDDDTVLNFSVYTVDGETVKLESGRKWKINGSSVYMSSEDKHVFMNDGIETDVVKYLGVEFIHYKLDVSGKIREINTAKKNARVGELGYSAGMNNPDEVYTNPKKYELVYKLNGKFFIPDMGSEASLNFVGVGNDTKIIKMPSANIKTQRENYFEKVASLKNDDDFSVVGYTMNGSDSITADVIVIVNDSSSDPTNSAYYVVKDIKLGINKEEEVGYKLLLYSQNGSEITVTTEKQSFPEYDMTNGVTGTELNIEEGDIIKYGVNQNGDAASFIMVYDANGNKSITENPNNWYVSRRIVTGSVYSTQGNLFTYIPQKDITGSVEGKLQMGFANSVVLVDPKADKKNYIRPGSVSDMTSYMEDRYAYANIVYISAYGETNLVVAYLK